VLSRYGRNTTFERIRMPRDPQRSGQPTHPFVVRFDAHVHAVPETRRGFVGWMRAAALDEDSIEDLEVVYSEVAANAVAASPSPADEVRVRALLDEAVLVLEVSNRTNGDAVPVVAPDLDDPLRPNGRGLLIARAFVDSVDIEADGPDRLRVRCCRRVTLPG
jgi:anti-sigma regulatory factor (Ser/Thr protein kinase)